MKELRTMEECVQILLDQAKAAKELETKAAKPVKRKRRGRKK